MNPQEESAKALHRRTTLTPQNYLLPGHALSSLPPKRLITPRECGDHFTSAELDIVESDAETILRRIREREWSAADVLEAFVKAAVVAAQVTNCVTVPLFGAARVRARELDEHLARTGSTVGLLHGLPVSLKDCFVTPPAPSSVGFVAWANEETGREEESLVARLVGELGGVVFVKTAVPVGMMMMETTNRLYGPTLNPFNRSLSAGGSSGGEAALLAMRGSPLGVGTDIGGSIRIPANFTHLYSLKPSSGRLPTWHTRSGIPGNEFITSVNGPMATSLSSLSLYCKAIIGTRPWQRDPRCIPLPWRGVERRKSTRLRLAFTPAHDGYVSAHPPVARALDLVKEAVEKAGGQVLEWDVSAHKEMVDLVLSGFSLFGASPVIEMAKRGGEDLYPSMRAYDDVFKRRQSQNEGNVKRVVEDIDRLRQMTMRRNEFQAKFLEKVRSGEGLDGIVMPVSPWAAVQNGWTNEGDKGRSYVGYTAVWNLLDVPVGTLPVGIVSSAGSGDSSTVASTGRKCVLPMERRVYGKKHEKFVGLNDFDRVVQESYDERVWEGAPVGLQVVGTERFGEEDTLGVVSELKELLERFG